MILVRSAFPGQFYVKKIFRNATLISGALCCMDTRDFQDSLPNFLKERTDVENIEVIFLPKVHSPRFSAVQYVASEQSLIFHLSHSRLRARGTEPQKRRRGSYAL